MINDVSLLFHSIVSLSTLYKVLSVLLRVLMCALLALVLLHEIRIVTTNLLKWDKASLDLFWLARKALFKLLYKMLHFPHRHRYSF